MPGKVGALKLAAEEPGEWSVFNDTVNPPADAHQIGKRRREQVGERAIREREYEREREGDVSGFDEPGGFTKGGHKGVIR